MSREADLPDGKIYKPTPQPLIELCLACRRVRCDGMKCDDYKKLEREIKMQQKKSEPSKPRMELEPIPESPYATVARAHGLRLFNITIEALDALLKEENFDDRNDCFAGMLEDLKYKRYKLYGNRINWKSLEDSEEMEV